MTEKQLDVELARSRYEQNFSRGLSFRTNIAYGVNSKAINHVPTATAIHDDNILLLDSGELLNSIFESILKFSF